MQAPGALNGLVKIAADLIAATFGGGADMPRPPAPQDA